MCHRSRTAGKLHLGKVVNKRGLKTATLLSLDPRCHTYFCTFVLDPVFTEIFIVIVH